MKTVFFIFCLALIFIFFSAESYSQGEPIQLSLFNPVQIVPENKSVTGLRFNLIYGKNVNVTGFDMGLVNHTTGIQNGIQWGLVNLTYREFTGWQDGFVNLSKGKFIGLQSGAISHHQGHFNGLQFSIVNYAATMKGLQIGLINIIGEGGFLPVFILFNFDFD